MQPRSATRDPRRRPWRGPAAGGGAACVALAAATLVLQVLPADGPDYPAGSALRGVLAGIAYGVLGAVVATRLPRTPVGWLMVVVGLSNAVSSFTGSLAHLLLTETPGHTAGALLHWVAGFTWVPGYTLVPSVLLLFLPTGSLPSPRWRWVVAVSGGATVAATVAWAVTPYDQRDIAPPAYYGELDHPVPLDGAWTAVSAILPVVVLGALLGVASLVLRLRRTSGQERDHVVLVAAGAAATLALLVAGWLLPVASAAFVAAAMVPLPAAITYAMVRRRLWDLDVVVNRALVYGALTVLTLAAYGALLAVLTGLAQRVTEDWELLLFVLAAMAVQPLKDRVQRAVNRLLYGQADEPYAGVSRLAERLTSASSPGAVLPAVVDVVARTLLLPYAELRVAHHGAVVHGRRDPGAETLTVPLVYSGRSVGELVVAVPPGGVGERGRRLLEELARHAAVAAHAAALQVELHRSREHIVTSREEERRRLRHDLHDDLGPGLAATAMQLDVAADLVHTDPDRAAAVLEAAAGYLRGSVSDVRRIVDDLRPAALDDLGLVPAVQEAAERLRTAGVEVAVTGEGPLTGLSAAAEVAAYRITAEALANVAKHSGARHVDVRLEQVDGVLTVRVADDGVGLARQATAGVGLTSMHQRATELGGSCTVTGGRGGTTVVATLPADRPAGPAQERLVEVTA
ncbi:sensor histidine kinase [Blastococcus sp. KM273129]|uniref:sensor histidine kinase n=1 Tax=Blastococcus sp. KM273129 TaxID=2570315 RepID=UPI001F171C9C|nr:sensor histidine kinase [Blastococcus sp. KM273129]MCF6736498.1 sensor histidine kinase [Blastococcus sp. KM273129]